MTDCRKYKTHESISTTKSTEKKINIDPKAPQIATRSSSRLKSLSEKLQNYFTDQDEEYFISQETDDVFVSSKSRKKKGNEKRRVRLEHRVMEYDYVCIWHCWPFFLLHHLVSSYTVMTLTISYQQRSIF